MPLYLCNAAKGAISDAAKAKIAEDITRIHCAVTGAPPQFVHAFFVEDAANPPLAGGTAFLFGSIRSGRTEEQKVRIETEMRSSLHQHTGIPVEELTVSTADTPASWVLEGGEIMPKPGEEAEWLARHGAH